MRIAREAVKRFPESSEALFRLASSLERAGNTAESEKVFLDLLRLRPNDAAAENYLGQTVTEVTSFGTSPMSWSVWSGDEAPGTKAPHVN